MSILHKLIGKKPTKRKVEEYEEFDEIIEGMGTSRTVHFVDLRGRRGVMDIKDFIEDGDVTIVNISYIKDNSEFSKRSYYIKKELASFVERNGGDIAQKGENQLIVTPPGVRISREKVKS